MFGHWYSCTFARFSSCVELIPQSAWRHRDPEGFLLLSSRFSRALVGITGRVVIHKLPPPHIHSLDARP
eukprot:668691-Pleurochrysis_carterae.AAC.7